MRMFALHHLLIVENYLDGIDEQSRQDPNIEINNSDHNFNFRSSDCSSSVGGGSSNSAIDSHIDNEYKIPLQRDNTMSASLIINSEGDKDKIRVQYMLYIKEEKNVQ